MTRVNTGSTSGTQQKIRLRAAADGRIVVGFQVPDADTHGIYLRTT